MLINLVSELIFTKPITFDQDTYLLSTSEYNPEESSFFYLWSIFADL